MNLFDKLPRPTRFIDSLQNNDKVEGFFRVQEVTKKKTKNGDNFLDLTVMDKTGRMPAKVWNNVEACAKMIQAGGIYKIRGEVREYKGKNQLTISQLQPAAADDPGFNPADYCETPPFDSAALFERMTALLDANLSNPHLRRLVELFKEEFGATLQQAYGAQKIHHAFAGGLLQHTHSLLEMVLLLAPHYGLDKELLLVGALFHDIGKTAEFKTQPALETTLAGGLLGHLVISLTMFINLKERIADFPPDLATHIEHLIVSHHGAKEYGSPEIPKTPEAYLLHILDLLDSRLSIFSEQRKDGDGQKLFSEFNQALGTRILLAKP